MSAGTHHTEATRDHQMLGRLKPVARNALRIAIGFLFWSHGAQKLFG
ncbi:MAG: hypothetical protein V3T28_10310 [Gemmatimonadales bacterium]